MGEAAPAPCCRKTTAGGSGHWVAGEACSQSPLKGETERALPHLYYLKYLLRKLLFSVRRPPQLK
jgi:hypothetical protein